MSVTQIPVVRFDGIDCIRVGEEVEVAMGVTKRIDRFLGTHEIEPQNRLIGKWCHRAASKPVLHPFHDHADGDHDLIFHHFLHDSMP